MNGCATFTMNIKIKKLTKGVKKTTLSAVLSEIITLLTSGLTQMATGIGGGLTALVTSVFLEGDGDTQKLSVFGGVIVIFAGVSLAIGLSRWVVNWVTTLGASN